MAIKYLDITKEEWVKRGKRNNRIVSDGIKYIMLFDLHKGTYLQPVKIKNGGE